VVVVVVVLAVVVVVVVVGATVVVVVVLEVVVVVEALFTTVQPLVISSTSTINPSSPDPSYKLLINVPTCDIRFEFINVTLEIEPAYVLHQSLP
jgi:hypothetical protein